MEIFTLFLFFNLGESSLGEMKLLNPPLIFLEVNLVVSPFLESLDLGLLTIEYESFL